MKPIFIIPARLKSTRLPNKPLLKIGSKSMIQLTVEKVLASNFKPVVVATDSALILQECSKIKDVIPVMTSENNLCGTERVLEAYNTISGSLGQFDIIVNIQGDEPFLNPALLQEALAEIPHRQHAEFWTSITQIQDDELDDHSVVKVVLNLRDDALIFTRSRIASAYKHTSVYFYTPDFLSHFCKLAPTPLEQSYSLEQMRALEHGLTLNCLQLPYDSIAINTTEDLTRAGIKHFELFQG